MICLKNKWSSVICLKNKRNNVIWYDLKPFSALLVWCMFLTPHHSHMPYNFYNDQLIFFLEILNNFNQKIYMMKTKKNMLYLPDLKPFAKLHILENLFLLTCWWFPFPMVKELDNYKCWEMVKPPFSSHAFIPFTAGRLLTIYFCFFPSVFFFHTCTLANSSALSWIYSDLVTGKYGNNDNKGARGRIKTGKYFPVYSM